MIGRIAARLPPALREDPEIASIIAEGRAHRGTCGISAIAPLWMRPAQPWT
jgi:hypothetical protein